MPQIVHLSGAIFSQEPPREYCQDEHCIYKSVKSPVFAPCAAWPGPCSAPWQQRFSWKWFWDLPQELQQRSTNIFMNLWFHLLTVPLWFWSPVALRLPQKLLGLFGKALLHPFNVEVCGGGRCLVGVDWGLTVVGDFLFCSFSEFNVFPCLV